jgi:hypothetical protein
MRHNERLSGGLRPSAPAEGSALKCLCCARRPADLQLPDIARLFGYGVPAIDRDEQHHDHVTIWPSIGRQRLGQDRGRWYPLRG